LDFEKTTLDAIYLALLKAILVAAGSGAISVVEPPTETEPPTEKV
jgi:hypothetical protein